MDAKTWFNEKMPAALEGKKEEAKEINAVFLFVVTGDKGGTWTADFKADTPSVKDGKHGEPDVTIELSDEDFELVMNDASQAMNLFFQGKMKITGDPMLGTKLQSMFAL